MNTNSFLWKFGIFLITIVFLSILLWLLLYNFAGTNSSKTPRDDMLIELSKVLGQFIFITITGATVTFLFNQYAKEQERYKNQVQEEFNNRLELLNALRNVRAKVESVRRNYRLFQPQNRKEGYRQTVDGLLRARLELSQVWHDLCTLKQLFPKYKIILAGLDGMKKYLDILIEEYEETINEITAQRDEDAEKFIIGSEFGKFIKDEGGEKYTKFLEYYRKSVEIIRISILPQ